MGKRKSTAREDDVSDASDAQDNISESDPEDVDAPKPKKQKKDKNESKSKAKVTKTPKASSSTDVEIHTNAEGEQYVELSKKRRVIVRNFKGSVLVDIREVWGDENKPGKKGIALSIDQWNALKAAVGAVDQIIEATPSK